MSSGHPNTRAVVGGWGSSRIPPTPACTPPSRYVQGKQFPHPGPVGCQPRQARGTNEEWKAVHGHKEGAIGGAIPGTNHLRDSAAKGLGVNRH